MVYSIERQWNIKYQNQVPKSNYNFFFPEHIRRNYIITIPSRFCESEKVKYSARFSFLAFFSMATDLKTFFLPLRQRLHHCSCEHVKTFCSPLSFTHIWLLSQSADISPDFTRCCCCRIWYLNIEHTYIIHILHTVSVIIPHLSCAQHGGRYLYWVEEEHRANWPNNHICQTRNSLYIIL